ncbi:MAG: ferrous iron transport protein A [Leptolyngbya sp. PLA3]|nr:MAG: ferrous iron transport protein A [Cyanobacteria bacterium CYA]MCE7967224.1 ferrous iron transport protein A [Leptolyngbya sp. PL-A3]
MPVRFSLPMVKRKEPLPDSGQLRVSDLVEGQTAKVLQTIGGESELAYLRALGIEPGAEVRVCLAGSPCVLGLGLACGGSCRIGIGRDMARRILVECICERAGIDDPVL